MHNNIYVPKLFDLIVPDQIQVNQVCYLFIVLEYEETDLQKVIESVPKLKFSEAHLIKILYNMLCAMNYIHSAGIMHRDIKP